LARAGAGPVHVTLWIEDQLTQSIPFDSERSATFNDDRQDFGGQVVQFKAHLTAGDRHLAVAIPPISEGVPARYEGPKPSARPLPPPKEFKPPPNATPERIVQ